MNLHKINEHFEEEAFIYDDLILRLIPKYAEQNAVVMDVIPFERAQPLNALDLGCGTGVLSYLICKEFSQAQVTAFDLVNNMLEVCYKNLKEYSARLTIKQGNFGADDIGQGYDIVVSGLSTHHLDNSGKAELYKRVFRALSPGGIFVNREIVLGATSNLTEQYHQQWRQFIRSNGEDDEKWFQKYLAEDIPASVEEQMGWLKDAGFVDVGCHWRYFNFAIFGGRKPE